MRLACTLLIAVLATGCISYRNAGCDGACAEKLATQERRIRELDLRLDDLRDAIKILEDAWNQSPPNVRFTALTGGALIENWEYWSKVSSMDTERNVVTLSIGKTDGVMPGFVFTVYRDGRYVGKVVIDDVREDHCSGYSPIELEATPLQPGDDARIVYEISRREAKDGGK